MGISGILARLRPAEIKPWPWFDQTRVINRREEAERYD